MKAQILQIKKIESRFYIKNQNFLLITFVNKTKCRLSSILTL